MFGAIGYAICIGLLCFALVERTGVEHPLAIAAVGFSLWAYLPVYGVIGFAVAARRKVLAVLSVLIVALHLHVAWPDVKIGSSVSEVARTAPRLTVFTSNVFFLNRDLSGGIFGEVLYLKPDIAVFQEVIEPSWDAIQTDEQLQALYPYRAIAGRSEGATVLISRLPIKNPRVVKLGPGLVAVATVVTAAGDVDVYSVHLESPVGRQNVDEWKDGYDDLAELVRSAPNPLVLAGDFNATVYHKRFRDLLDLGFKDAQSSVGLGMHATFRPRLRGRELVPLLRIDHILTTPQLVPLRVAVGVGRGSDHRPVYGEFALLPR